MVVLIFPIPKITVNFCVLRNPTGTNRRSFLHETTETTLVTLGLTSDHPGKLQGGVLEGAPSVGLYKNRCRLWFRV